MGQLPDPLVRADPSVQRNFDALQRQIAVLSALVRGSAPIVVLTAAEYAALSPPDPDTVYVIVG
jgi:hypothetical protein